jgi:hypothetical protein
MNYSDHACKTQSSNLKRWNETATIETNILIADNEGQSNKNDSRVRYHIEDISLCEKATGKATSIASLTAPHTITISKIAQSTHISIKQAVNHT